MFEFRNVYIDKFYTVVSKKEANGNIKNPDKVMNDYYYGEKTPFKCEVKMLNEVLNNLPSSDLVIASNLENQLASSNISMKNRNTPYMGLYSACASFSGGITTIANFIESKAINRGTLLISSHNLNAEKQFRFPIEYGAPKVKRSTQTATCAIGIHLTTQKTNIKVLNGTIGNVVDSYIKDTYNMGAVMALSAYDCLINHLAKTNTNIKDYDLIVTGDLGKVGSKIFKELCNRNGYKLKNYLDAGEILFEETSTSGASGPACLPLIYFYNLINIKKYKKVLLLSTGSLHNPEMVNQKETIPSITNALTIEVQKWQYFIPSCFVEQFV